MVTKQNKTPLRLSQVLVLFRTTRCSFHPWVLGAKMNKTALPSQVPLLRYVFAYCGANLRMSGEGDSPGDDGKEEAARIFMKKQWPI